MQLRWIRYAVALVAAGCESASSRPVNGPDGEPGWYAISCRGDMGNCEEEAGNACPHGYITADQREHEHPVVVSTYNAYGGSTFVGHKHRGNMLVKCK